MKKNNKGFTLVELLAVIVILSIIMVIAVMSINELINTSRAKAFNETMNIVVANAKVLFSEGELPLVEEELLEATDFNEKEYNLYVEYENKDGDEYVVMRLFAEGKFKSVKWEDIDTKDLNPKYHYGYTEGHNVPYIYTTIYSNGVINK